MGNESVLRPLGQHGPHPAGDVHVVDRIEDLGTGDLPGAAVGHGPAVVHEKHLGAVGPGQREIMDHGHHGPAGGLEPFGYEGKDVFLIDQVQMVGGLVQQQQPGALGEDLGEERALQLAAGTDGCSFDCQNSISSPAAAVN